MDQEPLPTDSIDDLEYIGAIGEYAGGLNEGDYIPDFQVYSLEGEPLRLYDEIDPEKYTILFSMSLSCNRVQDAFDPMVENQILSFFQLHGDNYNWIGIYTEEAHPADVENCPSNCPPIPTVSLDGDSIYSHDTYADRMYWASQMKGFAQSPDYTFTYPFGEFYLDHPNNSLYTEVFQAPFCIVVLDCAGNVMLKHPFMNQFFESWEWTYELFSLGEQSDSDGDMICDTQEEAAGSNPDDPCSPDGTDTDGDGYCDIWESIQETDIYNPCDPVFVDEDQDGICDFVDNDIDVPPCVQDPTDSDEDGFCDAEETINGTDPFDACDPSGIDSDGDGICNTQESLDGTNPYDICDPNDTDSDGDGYCDLEELSMVDGDPQDPCMPDFIDSDGDGICNLQEIQDGSNPADACDPAEEDTDGDGTCDLQENLDGSDPEDPCDPDNTDTDGDGVCDNQELLDGTDPFTDESVGIGEYSGIADLTVYPNPFGDFLTVASSAPLESVRVFSTDSRLVASWTGQSLTERLDVSALPAGAYTLQVKTDDQRLEVVRVLK